MIVGLTGGMGSGKSLVTEEFRRLGAKIVDADIVAREILTPNELSFAGVVSEFGEQILTPSGEINRSALAQIIFDDCESLRKLNQITHPEIIRRINGLVAELLEENPDAIIIIDAPLLIEVGLHKQVDRVVVVYADQDKQIERIKERDHLSTQEALKRLSCQMPLKEKIVYADHVIENSGTIEETIKRARFIFENFKEEQN